DGIPDSLCEKRPSVDGSAIFLHCPGEQKANAAAEWKALTLCLLKFSRDLCEGRGLQLKIGAGRQIKDRDRYLALGVFKSGNSRARREATRQFQTDTGPGRIGRF